MRKRKKQKESTEPTTLKIGVCLGLVLRAAHDPGPACTRRYRSAHNPARNSSPSTSLHGLFRSSSRGHVAHYRRHLFCPRHHLWKPPLRSQHIVGEGRIWTSIFPFSCPLLGVGQHPTLCPPRPPRSHFLGDGWLFHQVVQAQGGQQVL